MAQIKDAALCHIFTVHQNLTGNFTGICMGNQTIDTACNSTLPAAARPGNKNLLAGIYIKIDVMQRRFCLCIILKSKILK